MLQLEKYDSNTQPLSTIWNYYMAKASGRYNACTDWLTAIRAGHYAHVMPTGRFRIRVRLELKYIYFFFLKRKPCKKQLNSIDRSAVTGNIKPRPRRQGLSLRFSRNDRTLSY